MRVLFLMILVSILFSDYISISILLRDPSAAKLAAIAVIWLVSLVPVAMCLRFIFK